MPAGKRNRWLLLLAGVLIGMAAAFLALQLRQPFDGARLQPGGSNITSEGVKVTVIEGWQTPLESEDIVTAIEGRSLSSWLMRLFEPGSQAPGWRSEDSLSYTVLREGQELDVSVPLSRYPLATILAEIWGSMTFVLVNFFVSAYIFYRRPELPAAQAFFISGAARVSSGTWDYGLSAISFAYPATLWLHVFTIIGSFMLVHASLLHFALTFPEPLPMLKRFRWLLPVIYFLPYLLLMGNILVSRQSAQNILEWFAGWSDVVNLQVLLFLLLALIIGAYQFIRSHSPKTRQQMRWMAFVAVIAGGAVFFLYIVPPFVGRQAADPNVIGLIAASFPVVLAISILRHNLFDIDTILNRTLLYSLLILGVTTLYAVLVTALGTLFNTEGNFLISLASTGVIAVAIQPMHRNARRIVDRLMYGKREEPIEVLAQLGRQLQESLSPQAALVEIVTVLAQSLKLPYAAIQLDGDSQPIAAHGSPQDALEDFPIVYQSVPIGALQVARRSNDEVFNQADKDLLNHIALQAGAAAHAARLTADLQRSRQKIVTAREEERRRLRRDLHDGLGPSLATQTLRLEAARDLVAHDPEGSERLLAELIGESQTALADLRRLVYALRPPALDELGLVGAIREQALKYEHSDLVIQVQADDLPTLPAAVEVAAYRITQEAITNVARHAKATRCTVALASDPDLVLAIKDNGVGLPPDHKAGIGLTAMQERTAELGGSCHFERLSEGGTRIQVRIPLLKE